MSLQAQDATPRAPASVNNKLTTHPHSAKTHTPPPPVTLAMHTPTARPVQTEACTTTPLPPTPPPQEGTNIVPLLLPPTTPPLEGVNTTPSLLPRHTHNLTSPQRHMTNPQDNAPPLTPRTSLHPPAASTTRARLSSTFLKNAISESWLSTVKAYTTKNQT